MIRWNLFPVFVVVVEGDGLIRLEEKNEKKRKKEQVHTSAGEIDGRVSSDCRRGVCVVSSCNESSRIDLSICRSSVQV